MRFCPVIFRLGLLALAAAAVSLRAAETPAGTRHGYTVNVAIKADATGKPESIQLLDSEDTTPGHVLDKMAVAMAMKTSLPPHLKNGKAVKFTVHAPFFFPIDGDEGAEANQLPMARPKANTGVMPVYPLALAEKNEVGGAILELIVDAEGKITRLTTLRASHPEFNEAATLAVKQWTFTPAQKDGKAVESRFRLAVVFETSDKMADLKWRLAPRPSLGSFIVYHDNAPITEPAAAPAPAEQPATPPPAPAPDKK